MASRVALVGDRPTLEPILARAMASGAAPIGIDVGSAPTVFDVLDQTDVGRWHQRFVVDPATTERSGSAGRLDETLCDGTAGHVLSPAFGGPHALPLRLAVSSAGPVTVTVTDPRGHRLASRAIPGRRHTVTTFRIHSGAVRGMYSIVISPHQSPLGEAVRLSAFAL